MKLNKEVEKLIFDSALVANSVGVESFIIDEHGIRGMADGNMVAILKPSFDLDMPFDSLGVGMVGQFIQRYNLHANNEGKDVELELDDAGWAKTFKFKSKGLNIEYRCIKSDRVVPAPPKTFKFETKCVFKFTEDAIDMLKKGSVTMKADLALLTKDPDSDIVYIQMEDINKSVFKYEIDESVEPEYANAMFAHRYPIKILLNALSNSDGYVEVTDKTALMINKNTINIVIPPRV